MELKNSFLASKRVHLRPLEEEDAQGDYPSWLNDAEVCAGNSHHVLPYSRAEAVEYIRSVQGNTRCLALAIILNATNRHVGNVALDQIHPIYRSAELAILIGDRSVWGQGIGTEASRLMCDHGFNALNLNRIACGTFSGNVAMQKLATSLGMVQEGRRRGAAFKAGAFVDVLEYGVMRAEYMARFGSEEDVVESD